MPKLLSHHDPNLTNVPSKDHSKTMPARIAATSTTNKAQNAETPPRKPLWSQVATIPRNRGVSNNLKQQQQKIETVSNIKKSNINQIKQKQKTKSNNNQVIEANMNKKTNRVINKDQKPYFKLTYLTTP